MGHLYNGFRWDYNEKLLITDGYDPDWKPDRSKILYHDGKYTNNICEVDYPSGSNKVRLTSSGSDSSAKYNFDGSKIVFRSRRTGNEDIFVMDSDGSNQMRLTDDPADDNQPWWSPDGTKIVYGVGYSLWVMNSDGTNKQQLTLPGNGDQHAIYSPDGKYIAFTSGRSGNADIWVMNADGTNLVQLTTDSSQDEAVDWSPDGSKILFGSDRSGNSDRWMMMLGETPIPATIDIDQDTLNLKSTGKWITCYIELPEGYDVADIDISTILLEDTISAEANPTEIGDYDDDGIADLMVKFDRSAVQEILEVGEEVQIEVTGELTDGTLFEGTDTIWVIDTGKGKGKGK
ncbi:component of the Tol biopolymer transport system [Methanophagales archaeon]|nr:component of the Tol biopolymer transport system [Methanophagales archaeon]